MFWNWATITAIVGLIGWILPFVMLFIVPVNRKPSSATAWLLLIFLLPYLGLVIFLLLGSPKLSKRRRAEQHNMSELISKLVAEASMQPESAAILNPEIPPRYEPFVKLNASLGHLPAIAGNAIELLPEYNAVFARIAADIDTAQRFVHFEYFATSRDEETEAMRCTACGAELKATRTDLPFKVREHTIVILKNLPVLECANCMQYLIADREFSRDACDGIGGDAVEGDIAEVEQPRITDNDVHAHSEHDV